MWHRTVNLFQDVDWVNAFQGLIQLTLASERSWPAGPAGVPFRQAASSFINSHLSRTASEKHLIGGPLSLAVLEGLLRRKSPLHVDKSGIVSSQFVVNDSNNSPKTFSPTNRLNRIDDSFRLFEQVTAANRGRPCIGLSEMKQETQTLYGVTTDIYDMIDTWRNELVHGNEYWSNRLPTILNMICLLVLDEIDPTSYNNQLTQIQQTLAFWQRTGMRFPRALWEIYPPDL